MSDKYRFNQGSLYELIDGSYIHVFRNARCKTKQKALEEYWKEQQQDEEYFY